jgi:hypothetical protein
MMKHAAPEETCCQETVGIRQLGEMFYMRFEGVVGGRCEFDDGFQKRRVEGVAHGWMDWTTKNRRCNPDSASSHRDAGTINGLHEQWISLDNNNDDMILS